MPVRHLLTAFVALLAMTSSQSPALNWPANGRDVEGTQIGRAHV